MKRLFGGTNRGPSPGARSPAGRRGRRQGVWLTARGGVLLVFAASFAGLLFADLAHWGELADAAFFTASGLAAYHVRPGALLPVVVSTPLLFFFACVLEKMLTGPGGLTALRGTLTALGGAAPWLLAGSALTVAIALLRGLRAEVRALVVGLRS
jgi:hypothetical protein